MREKLSIFINETHDSLQAIVAGGMNGGVLVFLDFLAKCPAKCVHHYI